MSPSRSQQRSCCAGRQRLLPAVDAAARGAGVSHDVGANFESSASFLNDELVMKGCVRYLGSSTTVVTVNHSVPKSAWRLKYSVTTAASLYGTPFDRRYPGRVCVVTTLSTPG